MVDQKTDFFKVVNNFKDHENTPSVPIFKSQLPFEPKVTIVIPTYKRTGLLKEAIDSAINQVGYDNYDIIIADDDPERGCPTEKLLGSYSSNRISYYKNKLNLRMIGNMNRCFELTKAEWVVMLHDDDLLLPDFLAECMKVVSSHPDLGILKPAQYEMHEQSDIKSLHFPATNKITRVYDTDNCIIRRIVAPSGILFNREKVFQLGGFNPEYMMSMDFCLIVLFAHFFKVYYMHRVLSVYRWIMNESLKLSTLNEFVIVDFHLYSFLFKHFRIPKKLAANILDIKFSQIEKSYQIVNKDFSFDVSTLGVKTIKRIPASISYRLLQFIVLGYRFIYFCTGDSIYKKRRMQLDPK
jgi:glycosyltransferase involved in cell wall biosynthesis